MIYSPLFGNASGVERGYDSLDGDELVTIVAVEDANIMAKQSPRPKPGRVRRDADCSHRPSLEHPFLLRCVPHARAPLSTVRYPLVVPRHGNGVQVHPRLLSRLLTICRLPLLNPIPIHTQEMSSVRVERDCPHRIGATGINHNRMFLLNCQSRTIENCYTSVFVDGI